jgi:hypothetical protein
MTRTSSTAPGPQEGEGSSTRTLPTRRRRRPSAYKKRPANLDRYTCDIALDIVATKVEVAKANNGGILKYKAMTDIVESMKPTLSWLTKGMVRNHINKLNKKVKMRGDAARPEDDKNVIAATANNDSGEFTSTLSALTLSTNSNTLPGTTMGTTAGDDNVGGRPKGSTAKSKCEAKQRKRLATLEATRRYQEELKKRRKQGGSTTRLMHSTLATIIGKAKALYNVENLTIHPSTIRSRSKRNQINPVVLQGTPSPMAAAEPYLIAVILQLPRMRNPVNATTGLHHANSMIQGTEIAKAIIAKWAKRKKQAVSTIQDSTLSLSTPTSTAHSTRTGSTAVSDNANNSHQQSGAEKSAEGETTMLLGTGYWNRFMRRHRHVIRSKPSVKFEVKGAEWCRVACSFDSETLVARLSSIIVDQDVVDCNVVADLVWI